MGSTNTALEALLTLIEDYHDFNPVKVETYQDLPTRVEFSKQVSRGTPCVYAASDLLKNSKASRWTRQDLIDQVGAGVEVEVAVTPDGRADSLCHILPLSGQDTEDEEEQRVFLQPANIDMTLRELFEKLEQQGSVATRQHNDDYDDDAVYYLQSQNGNLTNTPLAPLFTHLPKNFPFAQDVLGEAEAVNIWIGDERSITSTHRDPYENLYVVLRGSKTFTLWPPVDEVCMDVKPFRTGRYIFDKHSKSFTTILEHSSDPDHDHDHDHNNLNNNPDPNPSPPTIPWVTIDPSLPRPHLNSLHPLYKYSHPRTITVPAGHILYLPSGWYHHVTQKCGIWDDGTESPCISVNYWYDQDYEGEKYVMRQLISRLTEVVKRGG